MPEEIPPEALLERSFTKTILTAPGGAYYGPVGCDNCLGTGYKGRVGIYEVMPITDEMRQDHHADRKRSISPSRRRKGRHAIHGNRDSSRSSEGVTSLEEIEAVTNE